jgi:hypothetical protein
MRHKLNLFFEKKPVLSFILLALLLACLQGSVSFCSKKNCAAFSNANFDSWFPYRQGQTVYYATINNEVDSLVNITIYKSPASTSSGGFSSRACVVSASVQSQYIDSADPYLHLNYIIDDGSATNTVQLNINQFFVSGTNITDSGITINAAISMYPVQSSFYNSLTIEGKNYSDVQMILRDTAGLAANSVCKIWIAKNIGLLAYQEYPSLTIWLKQ